MKPARRIRRLAELACVWLGLAVAFAAMSVPPPVSGHTSISPPPGWHKHPPLPLGHWTGPVYQVHTVVIGGMPGWQIALIAAGAALVAATAGGLLDWTWTARRRSATAAPEPSAPGVDVLSVP